MALIGVQRRRRSRKRRDKRANASGNVASPPSPGSEADLLHLRTLSTATSLGIPGYYVDGALSELDVALLAPLGRLYSSLGSNESVTDHLDKLIKRGDPAVRELFGGDAPSRSGAMESSRS